MSIRPAPDAMSYVTALLPMAAGVAVYAALRRAADTCSDGRGRGQVMADTLAERVTGRPADVPVPVAVQLVLTDETLLGGATDPARLAGYGPIPAAVARHLIAGAVGDERSTATLLRLYRHPRSGGLVAMESRAPLPEGPGDVHRAARRLVPHTVLRCADPAHRPCAAGCPGRPHQRPQRRGHLRGL